MVSVVLQVRCFLHLRWYYIKFQMFSYACKVIAFAFLALYTANFFRKSLQQTMEIPLVGKSLLRKMNVSFEGEAATGFDPFTGKYDQTCLSRNIWIRYNSISSTHCRKSHNYLSVHKSTWTKLTKPTTHSMGTVVVFFFSWTEFESYNTASINSATLKPETTQTVAWSRRRSWPKRLKQLKRLKQSIKTIKLSVILHF